MVLKNKITVNYINSYLAYHDYCRFKSVLIVIKQIIVIGDERVSKHQDFEI